MFKLKSLLTWLALIMIAKFTLSSCGNNEASKTSLLNSKVHLNFYIHQTTMLLGVSDASVSEITIQRFNCPEEPSTFDYTLNFIDSEKVFILNEEQKMVEGCSLRVTKVKAVWKERIYEFALLNEVFTSVGTVETVLANSSKTAFLNSVLPAKLGFALDRDFSLPLTLSYIDTQSRQFPLVATSREPGVTELGLTISRLEDRGVVNNSWREFGVSLSCAGPYELGFCNGIETQGLTARLALKSDVDINDAEQIRFHGGLASNLFRSGLTHLIGSGLRFTLNTPTEYYGRSMYLILMKGKRYSVFEVAPDLVAAANQ